MRGTGPPLTQEPTEAKTGTDDPSPPDQPDTPDNDTVDNTDSSEDDESVTDSDVEMEDETPKHDGKRSRTGGGKVHTTAHVTDWYKNQTDKRSGPQTKRLHQQPSPSGDGDSGSGPRRRKPLAGLMGGD